jgi:hypothetical protein
MAARSPALTVVAHCPLRWEELPGNDRVRFCGQCRQHVYNVSRMTAAEATALIQEREGRACVRLQRRADGTVITRDCWHTVRRARERLVATAAGLIVAAAGFWSGVGALRRWLSADPAPLPAACPPPPPPPPAPASKVVPVFVEPPPRPRPHIRRQAPKPAAPVIRKRELEEELGLGDLELFLKHSAT